MTLAEHAELTRLAREWLSCSDDGWRDCGGLLHGWLEINEPVSSVPVSELQALLDGPDLQGGVWNAIKQLIAKHSPKPELPPNPHPQGTYLWAREEHARRHSVGRSWWSRRVGGAGRAITPDSAWEHCSFTHDDFIATDWEVVP